LPEQQFASNSSLKKPKIPQKFVAKIANFVL
jgi:hypothetical protein